jgi:hypothetical protein
MTRGLRPRTPGMPQTIEMAGVGRTVHEMTLAASLVPCAHCGVIIADGSTTAGPMGDKHFIGTTQFRVHGVCKGCTAERKFVFTVDDNPWRPRERKHEPSQVLDPAKLRAEVARLAPKIREDPRSIQTIAEWASMKAALPRLRSCLELLKDFDDPPSPMELERLVILEKRLEADLTRIHELHFGKREPREEIAGLIFQAMSGVPTVDDLRCYFESRKIHARTTKATTGLSIDMVEGERGEARLIGVEIREDALGVVAAMTISEVDIDDILTVQHNSPLRVLEGPSWDDRKNDWSEPLPSPLAISVSVGREEDGAPRVTFTPSFARNPRIVEVRFWRDRAAFNTGSRSAAPDGAPTDLKTWRQRPEPEAELSKELLEKVRARAYELVQPAFVQASTNVGLRSEVIREPLAWVIAVEHAASGDVITVLTQFRHSYVAQSGSDWGAHELAVYDLTLSLEGAIVDERLIHHRIVQIHENDEASYLDGVTWGAVTGDILEKKKKEKEEKKRVARGMKVAAKEPPTTLKHLAKRRDGDEVLYSWMHGNVNETDPCPKAPPSFEDSSATLFGRIAVFRDGVDIQDAWRFSSDAGTVYVDAELKRFRHDDVALMAAVEEKFGPSVAAEVAHVLADPDAFA